VEQTGPVPPGDSPELVAAPDDSSSGPHMAYAVQWWLFAAAVPVGWVSLARRDKREIAEAAARAAAAATAPRRPEQAEPATA
ncbi:SURF1 family protein, partial [Streptomyces sp. DT17]